MRANRVERTEVMAVPAPQFTQSWHPMAHGDVLRATLEAINTMTSALSGKYSSLKTAASIFTTFTLENGGSLLASRDHDAAWRPKLHQ